MKKINLIKILIFPLLSTKILPDAVQFDKPPLGKIIAYELTKKGYILPDVIWQAKMGSLFDHFFFGTTIGVDLARINIKKNFDLGLGGLRVDLLKALLDVILIKTKSDVTQFKYGDIFDDNFCGVFKSCIATNIVLPVLYFKIYFIRLNLIELNLGDFIYMAKVLFSTDLILNQDRYVRIAKFAKINVIARIFIPSIQIDLGALINLCRKNKDDDSEIKIDDTNTEVN